MARLVVANEGEAPRVWSVTANVLNKQSRTVYKGWSYRLRVEQEVSPYREKESCNEMLLLCCIGIEYR
jgi:hypothetical protein